MLSHQAAARPCHLMHPPPKSLILQGNYGTAHANVARSDQIPSAISSYTSLSQAPVAPEGQPGSFLFHVSPLVTLMMRRGSVPSTIPARSEGSPAGALLPQEHCVAKVTRKRFRKLSFLCSSPQLLTRVHYIWLLFSPLRVSYHRLIKNPKIPHKVCGQDWSRGYLPRITSKRNLGGFGKASRERPGIKTC